jgi:hypothetical protein
MNMRKLIVFLMLVVLGFSVYWFLLRTKDSKPAEPKQAPITVKKHTDAFNSSIDRLMASYYGIKDAFVEADTTLAKKNTVSFIGLLDSIPVSELEKDDKTIAETAKATLADLKSNAESLLKQTDITEMRQDFRTVSDMLYPAFFKIINYEGPALFLQNCPMAFDGDKDANWISNSSEIVNPYLGKHHPKFKATMLNCGEVKDSIAGTF